jgi:fructokinase
LSPQAKLLAGVELGGTKCVCVLGTGPDDVRAIERLPTGEREATLREVEAVLERWRAQYGSPRALGIASFGPVDLKPGSPTWGFITSTSKTAWRDTNVAQRLRASLGVPVGLDTDVNGAALAEGRWGGARGLDDYAYVTVGTGIGVGSIVRGRSIFGLNHTELGHIRVARVKGDTFPGVCPFHGDCIEGLASGPAIEARAGKPASQLPPDHPAWDHVVHGLAQLLHTMVLTTAPTRIFLGGGVMSAQAHLFGRIQRELKRSLNRYVESTELDQGLEQFIVPPGLGTMAGPLGALALAADAETYAATQKSPVATVASR